MASGAPGGHPNDPQKMAGWLARQERSGWSWAELSRRSGLPSWKLRCWHERLKRKPPPQTPARSFVAVEIADSAQSTGVSLGITTPSGYRLLVPPNFDAEVTARRNAILERILAA